MEKVSRKTTKLCSFYVSDWHLVTMLLPYLNEEINKENKIVTLLETNIKEKGNTSKKIKSKKFWTNTKHKLEYSKNKKIFRVKKYIKYRE